MRSLFSCQRSNHSLMFNLSFIDAPEVSHISSATRDRIMALQNTAAIDKDSVRSERIDSKCNWSWSRWCRFLAGVELGDNHFLDRISEEYRPSIFACFAQALRDGEFSHGSKRVQQALTFVLSSMASLCSLLLV